MKYTVSNIINAPLEKVAAKLMDHEGAKEWLAGLQKMEHVSGTPGQVGAKSILHIDYKGRKFTMAETIIEQNMPHQIKFEYSSQMGSNTVELKFEKLSENSVKQTNNTFFDMKGGKAIMGWLFKGMFRKQSLGYMEAFKKYVEKP